MNGYARQGDVLISKIDSIPKKAVPKKDLIVAEGEITGHHHQFLMNSPVELYTLGDEIYAHVLSETVLIHDEHHQIPLKEGDYLIQIQEEVDVMGNLRRVTD